jgi:hypothetical protein
MPSAEIGRCGRQGGAMTQSNILLTLQLGGEGVYMRRIQFVSIFITAGLYSQPNPAGGRLTPEDLKRINDTTVRFDLNYLRLNPAALDQKPVMRYFAALNNCNHRDVERALFNELDYPAVAARSTGHPGRRGRCNQRRALTPNRCGC